MKKLATALALVGCALLLEACAYPVCCDHPSHHTRRSRTPEVGVQVWNDGSRTIVCTAEMSRVDAGSLETPQFRTLEVPPARRFDGSLGGDPDAMALARFPVEGGTWRLRLTTPSGTYESLLCAGKKDWAIASVGTEQLSVTLDSGPRFLE